MRDKWFITKAWINNVDSLSYDFLEEVAEQYKLNYC